MRQGGRGREREAWEGDRKGGRMREGGMEGGEGGEGEREREGGRGDECWCYKALFLMF